MGRVSALKIIIDENKCVGCGLCVNDCPDVFELNDEGIATLKGNLADENKIKEVAGACPTEAMEVK